MGTHCEQERLGKLAATLAAAHSAELVALARAEDLDGEAALDAVQDAFCGFLRAPDPPVGQPAEARAVLAAFVRNVARNQPRRHHRARPHDSTEPDVSADWGTPEALFDSAQRRVQLATCLRQLDDVRRSVVRLRMLEELSGADAARALGMTPGNVAVLLHRAKQQLRACMHCDED